MRFPVSILIPVVALWIGTDAWACPEGPPIYVEYRTVLPADGDTGVPVNASLVVTYERGLDLVVPDTISLRPAGGQPVALAARARANRYQDVHVLTPAVPLRPDTTYEVLDTIRPIEEDADWECADDLERQPICTTEPVVVAAFTTGSGPDTTAPAVASATMSTSYFEVDAECESGAYVAHRFELGALTEDSAWTLYNYYDDGGRLIAGPRPLVGAGRTCSGGNWSFFDIELESEAVTLRAVDLAGNEEPTGHTFRAAPCDDFEGGCSAGGAGAGAGALVGLVGLALSARRTAGRSVRSRGPSRW